MLPLAITLLALGQAAEPSCPVPGAFLRARLSGTVNRDIHWSAADMQCEGMSRPDDAGIRLSFASRDPSRRLVLVFGVPALKEGASGKAVPVNVTIIRNGRLYGTRGADKCLLDTVTQHRLSPEAGARRWRVSARGFCLDPARVVSAATGDSAILLATFDFVGVVSWGSEAAAAP